MNAFASIQEKETRPLDAVRIREPAARREDSPCVVIDVARVRAAINTPWRPRTMHEWLT